MRPAGRIFVSSNRRMTSRNGSQIALRSAFLATKTAFYAANDPIFLRKIDKFYDFIIGHKLSTLH
ncbi:MAG TPA: hypothetical protein DIW62_14030 [Raoultella sp.]|nr:hypothetical protein [Raoultella sp.]